MPNGTHAVVLTTRDESQLAALERTLLAHRIDHVAIREVDPPFFGQLMAIGLLTARKEELRRFLSSLPLLR